MALWNTEEIRKRKFAWNNSIIISLVPSFSCTLWHITRGRQPSGITKFCIDPPDMFRTVRKVGGTKNINIAAVKELSPGLVVASREENRKEQVEALAEFADVWVSDIKNLTDMMEWIEIASDILDCRNSGRSLILELESVLNKIKGKFKGERVAYMIWKEPWMAAGGDTFIHSMLEHLGLKNIFGQCLRYPVTTLEQLKILQPDYIFFSTEPFPFKHQHLLEFSDFFSPGRLILVKGEMFSWYGSALLRWENEDYFVRN